MSITMTSPFLDGIDVQHVTAYLGGTGWTRRADFPRPELLVFDGPMDDDGEPIQAVIPSSTELSDFRRRLADLLNALSVLEDRPALEIALDMLNPSVDRVRARVLSEIASSGSLPLPFASVLLDSLRELVTAAACAEEDPRPFYAKATKIGTEHAQSWRFGQTRPGSFVASIECPVIPTMGQPPSANEAPLSRRVTTRIMRGLGDLHRAVLDGRPDALRDAYRAGLNANMCEALLSLRRPGLELKMEFEVQWSRRLPAADEVPKRVRVDGPGFDFLEATAKALRAPSESGERAFTGEIVKLHRELSDERIAVLRFVDGGRRFQAQVNLSPEDYGIACDAHRDSRPVTLQGRLERISSKKWRILGVRGFKTIDPPK